MIDITDANLNSKIMITGNFASAMAEFAGLMGQASQQAAVLGSALRSGFDGSAMANAGQKLDGIKNRTRQNANEQERHNRKIREGAHAANPLISKLKTIAGIYLGMQGVKKFVGLSDELTGINSRMALMNDGLQSTAALNDLIFQSAQRSRGEYVQTANTIATLGNQTDGLFNTNKELIQFSEVLNKQFAIAQTPIESQKSAMLQLTQALGSGILRGEEFNAVFEASPNIIRLIADEMGVSVGQMRNMAAQGEITADIVKNALLNAADETNKAFEAMPMTFAQMATSAKNQIIRSFEPAVLQFNRIINHPLIQSGLTRILGVIDVVGNGFFILGLMAEQSLNWIAENWDWLSNVVMVVGGVILTYLGMMTVLAMQKMIIAGKTAIITFVKAAAAMAMANLPLFLIIAGLVLIIGIALKMGATIGDVIGFIVGLFMAGAAIIANGILFIAKIIVDVIGFAVGLFMAGAAMVANGILFIVNLFIFLGTQVLNVLMMIGYAGQVASYGIEMAWAMMCFAISTFFVNAMNGVLSFFNMVVNKIIDGVNWVINALNKISISLPDFMGGGTFGFNIQTIGHREAVQLQAPKLSDYTAGIKKPELNLLDAKAFDYINVGDMFSSAKNMVGHFDPNYMNPIDVFSGTKNMVGGAVDGFVSNVGDRIKSAKDSLTAGFDERVAAADLTKSLAGGPGAIENGVADGIDGSKAMKDAGGNLKDIKSELVRTADDLTAIKDIMTQRAITNVTWDKIEVMVNNQFGDVHKDVDLDGWIDGLSDGLKESVNSTLTGVVAIE